MDIPEKITMDKAGRVLIPSYIRKLLSLKEGSEFSIEIYQNKKAILLKSAQSSGGGLGDKK